jgi:CheY-like chemotaxis protein
VQGARLLVVEDEANLRLVIQKELQRLGYRVQVAPDGEAALRKLDGRHGAPQAGP